MNDCVLELERVTKRFGDFTAVEDVSLRIPRGCIYGFLGPNGAGKTTTIRMIVDILRPTSGRISILGASSALDVRTRIGYLPEEKGLYKKMTAAATIAYFGTLKGMTRKRAAARARELLIKYGLEEFVDSKIEDLSKGMSQKVQVLSTIVHAPEFVILDEPFSGLDPVNQLVLEELILDMAHSGVSIVFSTHVMQHAERLCEQLLLISGGRKIFDGTVEDAKKTIPRRILVKSSSEARALSSLDGVLGVIPVHADGSPVASPGDPGSHSDWEIRISEQTDSQDLLEQCFAKGIVLQRFDHTEPSLHDAFVALIGADVTPEQCR
jgi:ABC-2 type transport system ATP-binding protein